MGDEGHVQPCSYSYDPATGTDSNSFEDNARGDGVGAEPAQDDFTPEEKAEEKARLQELVKDFARRAVVGVECIAVDINTGESAAARYSVDRRLQQLILGVLGQN